MTLNSAAGFAPLSPEEHLRAEDTHPPPRKEPIVPVPKDAKPFSFRHPAYGLPKAKWPYHDTEGFLVGYAARFEFTNTAGKPDKEVLPITYCELDGGGRGWRSRALKPKRPLFRLPQLLRAAGAPVLVTEGEKKAERAAALFPDYVTTTTWGGSKAAHLSDFAPLAGRRVTIWPDNDLPGKAYASQVAELALEAGAEAAFVVDVPAGFPPKWDLADDQPPDVDLRHLLDDAKQYSGSANAPLPLFPPMPAADPYPTDALGPVLGSAAMAIASKVKTPPAVAGQSVLAAASLVAQAYADVQLPFGQPRPLSLFMITVAGSGDRKTTADNEALWPIRKYEKALRERREVEMASWVIDKAAWAAEHKKIEADRKLGYEARKTALRGLGPEPLMPLYPILTIPDPTIEGMAKAWVNAPPALGMFSAEGGQFVGGHGMSNDNRLKTAGALSELWDGKPMRRVRAGDGVTILEGRRLALHMMVQPDAAAKFLGDDLLRDQGLLSRMLVAAPDSIAGTRLYAATQPEDDAAIRRYGARLLSILETPPPLAEGSRNELVPPVLMMDNEAEIMWQNFHDHIERQQVAGGDLRPIMDFASKAAEHAGRIAGVLAIVEDHRATTITAAAMARAIELAAWYTNETCRLQRHARTDPRLVRADQLLRWMLKQPYDPIPFRDILQFGPASCRQKAAADDAVSILAAHHWVEEVSLRPRLLRVYRRGEGR